MSNNTTHHGTTYAHINDIAEEEATLLIQITNPSTPELREAAYSHLYKLSSRTSLWKNEKIWQMVSFLLDKRSSNDIRDGLTILANMVKVLEQHSDRNAEIKKVQDLYFNRLKEWSVFITSCIPDNLTFFKCHFL